MLGTIKVGTVWNPLEGHENIYIGRSTKHPSPLGNPYVINAQCSRDQACDRYAVYLRQNSKQKDNPVRLELSRIAALVIAGKDVNLQCYCKPPLRCHGSIIKQLVDTAVQRKLEK